MVHHDYGIVDGYQLVAVDIAKHVVAQRECGLGVRTRGYAGGVDKLHVGDLQHIVGWSGCLVGSNGDGKHRTRIARIGLRAAGLDCQHIAVDRRRERLVCLALCLLHLERAVGFLGNAEALRNLHLALDAHNLCCVDKLYRHHNLRTLADGADRDCDVVG